MHIIKSNKLISIPADHAKISELHQDFERMKQQWRQLVQNAGFPPTLQQINEDHYTDNKGVLNTDSYHLAERKAYDQYQAELTAYIEKSKPAEEASAAINKAVQEKLSPLGLDINTLSILKDNQDLIFRFDPDDFDEKTGELKTEVVHRLQTYQPSFSPEGHTRQAHTILTNLENLCTQPSDLNQQEQQFIANQKDILRKIKGAPTNEIAKICQNFAEYQSQTPKTDAFKKICAQVAVFLRTLVKEGFKAAKSAANDYKRGMEKIRQSVEKQSPANEPPETKGP